MQLSNHRATWRAAGGVLLALLWPALSGLAASAADDVAAFRNVNVVPMTKETVLTDHTVLVRNGRITALGPTGSVDVPAEAVVIDGAGGYLVPGLADMHTHINERPVPYSVLNLFLANGVTSIRDLTQGSPPSILHLREEIAAGRRLGPTIYTAFTLWGNEEDPAAVLARKGAQGYDCVKFNSYFTRGAFDAAVQQARAMNLYALGHTPFAVSVAEAVDGGLRESSHVLELAWELVAGDRRQDLTPGQWEELIITELIAELSAHLDDTPEQFREAYQERMAAIVAGLAGRDFRLSTTLIADHDIMMKLTDVNALGESPHAAYISRRFYEDLVRGKDRHVNLFAGDGRLAAAVFRISALFLTELHRNGVPVVLGTDVGPTYLSLAPGFAVHDELAILRECGFTPFEALETCTTRAAEVAARMTGRNEFGTVAVGKRADLLLVSGNPLEDLTVLRDPLGVMAAGRWLPAARLAELRAVCKTDILPSLREAYRTGGLPAARQAYEGRSQDNLDNRYLYSENTLNRFGYDLLGKDLVADAIAVFELGVSEFPASANLWDSLAEANLLAGKQEAALSCCRRALAIDPELTSTLAMVDRIEGGR